ncbi:MAG: ZIP family metal transporter [Defluviitaleaceae bacterium]|nr:ZIP family metal transporter [Defluviitaleaceae bacterium]
MFENMPDIVRIIILAGVAGLGSSVLGGTIAVIFGRPNRLFIGLSFVFVAAVLITLVFIDFIPHAIGHGHYHMAVDSYTGLIYQYWHQHSGAGIWLTVVGVAIGVGLIVVLSLFDKHGHEHIHGVLPHSEHCSHEDAENAKAGLTSAERRRVIAVAFPVTIAIILHDLPKGLAIGSSGSIFAAIAIGLSCIPEGMSIAIPLKAGGTKTWKILGICGIAGFATVMGALIGYLLGGINVYVSGVMFAIAAGCLLGVVFSEILPLAFDYTGRSKWKFLAMAAGVLVVVALNYSFHDLMH